MPGNIVQKNVQAHFERAAGTDPRVSVRHRVSVGSVELTQRNAERDEELKRERT